MSAPDKLKNEDIAPHGWVKIAEPYSESLHGLPYLETKDGVYVPAKREPREWIKQVVEYDYERWVDMEELPVGTRVRVTEILEEETP